MELCLAKERVIVNEHRRGEGSTCKDREKHQASNSRRHFVYSLENNGVNFERHIEYSINECQVCGGGRNNGLETKHAQRTCEHHCSHLFGAFLLKFYTGEYLVISSRFSKCLGISSQEHRPESFEEEEKTN